MNFLQKVKNWFTTGNHALLTGVIALILLGVFVVYALSPYASAHLWLPSTFFIIRYIPYLLIGIVMLAIFSILPRKWLIRICYMLCAIGLLMMLNTWLHPVMIAGSSRWVKIFGTLIDPYMFTLAPYTILMSYLLTKDGTKNKRFWTGIACGALTLLIVALAVIAPYIRMAIMYVFVFLIMAFASRKNNPIAFYISCSIIVAFILAMLYTTSSTHTMVRLTNGALSHYAHASSNVIANSTLLGNTPESLIGLTILADPLTDNAFVSVLAKFGYLFGVLILALYLFVARSLFRNIKISKDEFYRFVNLGTLSVFVFSIITSLLTAFGIHPMANYLPFIAYSSMGILVMCILFGASLSSPQNKRK